MKNVHDGSKEMMKEKIRLEVMGSEPTGELNLAHLPYGVLIVDEEMVRNLLVSILSESGQICETAKEGFEALDRVKSDPLCN